jgi:hypothetical protein
VVAIPEEVRTANPILGDDMLDLNDLILISVDDHIIREKAMRWYSFDPFVHVPREEATVDALRSAAGRAVPFSPKRRREPR